MYVIQEMCAVNHDATLNKVFPDIQISSLGTNLGIKK